METIGSKRSYALIWCMPNNDDDDADLNSGFLLSVYCASTRTTMHTDIICGWAKQKLKLRANQ